MAFKKPSLLLWCHIATTGLEPEAEQIIELYMRLTDMRAETTHGVYYACVRAEDLPGIADIAPEVHQRHERSGLLADAYRSKLSEEKMVAQLTEVFSNFVDNEVWLAGYAPSFCRGFLRYVAPIEHLHFQEMNLTSLEKFFEVVDGPGFKRAYAARVKASVDAAVEQYRDYLLRLAAAGR